MNDNECSNPFAIALVFYFNYRRNKLTTEFILKLIKKYHGGTSANIASEMPSSSRLLSDLKKKYDMYAVPETVSYHEIIRVLSYVEIPLKYYPIFSISSSDCTTIQVYDSAYDILSQQFQPDKVLQNKCLYSKYHTNDLQIRQYDNLSKLKHLIPGLAPPHSSVSSIATSTVIVNINSTSTRKRNSDHIIDSETVHVSVSDNATTTDVTNTSNKNIHILHRIAQHSIVSTPCISKSTSRTTATSISRNSASSSSSSVATTANTSANSTEEWCLVNSPFSLLYDIMRNKALCRIYLRRHPK